MDHAGDTADDKDIVQEQDMMTGDREYRHMDDNDRVMKVYSDQEVVHYFLSHVEGSSDLERYLPPSLLLMGTYLNPCHMMESSAQLPPTHG